MVTAILDGRKTQTRRIVKIPDLIKEPDRYHYVGNSNDFDIPRKAIPYDDRLYHAWRLNNNNMPMWVDHCPYGKIGDVLWVRETWNKRKDILSGIEIYIHKEKHVRFKRPSATEWKWKPSIFMPKEACRITLEITNIRVERLQHISWEDALSEGIDTFQGQSDNCYDYLTGKYAWSNPVNSYMTLWEKINGSGSVAINPWVWVIEFKVKARSKYVKGQFIETIISGHYQIIAEEKNYLLLKDEDIEIPVAKRNIIKFEAVNNTSLIV